MSATEGPEGGGGAGRAEASPGGRAAAPAEDERSLYYRGIARAFFERRGAPFFLSPREIDLVASWEAAGIPLAVVREGLERAFDDPRRAGDRRRMSLLSCEREVSRAFERHRDRLVGARRAASPAPDKRARLRAEVGRFLAVPKPGDEGLASILAEAARALDAGAPDEELERLDAAAESLLLSRVTPAERDEARREVAAEHGGLSPADLAAAADLRLLKSLRARSGLPRLSPFYY